MIIALQLKFEFDGSYKAMFPPRNIILHIMEFQNEKLVQREIEIAGCLLKGFSIKQISETTGLSKKHLAAHLRNMMEKLGVDNTIALIEAFKSYKNFH